MDVTPMQRHLKIMLKRELKFSGLIRFIEFTYYPSNKILLALLPTQVNSFPSGNQLKQDYTEAVDIRFNG